MTQIVLNLGNFGRASVGTWVALQGHMTRTWPSLLLSLALLITLVACGDDDGGGTDTNVLSDADPGDTGGADVGTDADGGGVDTGTGDTGTGDTGGMDAGVDTGDPPDTAMDTSTMPPPDYPADWPRGRGWDWVRNNEPFVSALSVRMGAPPRASVNRYFDDFGANAVHLWQTGIPTAINGWLDTRPDARWLSWVDRNGNSSENRMLLGGAGRPTRGLIGYQIGDEPRDRAHFNDIMAAMARVRAADPAPLRIFNFTYQADEIDAFLRDSCASGDMDIISYDRYSLGNSTFETMALFRDAAQRCGVPYWRYLRGYNPAGEAVQAESDLRWDAFTGLLFGYTGHSWFLYNVRGGAAEGIPTTFFGSTDTWGAATTPRFTQAAAINRELIVYSRAQMQLRSTAVALAAEREIPGTWPPEGLPSWRMGAGGDRFLRSVDTDGGSFFQDVMFGFFEDRYRDTYVMVLNPTHENGSFPTEGNEATRVTLGFDFGASGITRLRRLRPDGTLVNVDASSGSASFNIAAGDVVFFKYDTGNPFAGY